MASINLGQVRDKITSVSRTSGTGQPGQTDTYTIYTECSPSGAGTFNVYNGTNGQNGITLNSFTAPKTSDLNTYLSSHGIYVSKIHQIYAKFKNNSQQTESDYYPCVFHPSGSAYPPGASTSLSTIGMIRRSGNNTWTIEDAADATISGYTFDGFIVYYFA